MHIMARRFGRGEPSRRVHVVPETIHTIYRTDGHLHSSLYNPQTGEKGVHTMKLRRRGGSGRV